jgi:hypothetical protein
VKAYLTAHGTDPNQVDEETFTDICIMYNDGLIGNFGLMQVLGTLTAGQFNTMLPKGKQPYKLQHIIPTQYEYLYPPRTEQDKSKSLNDALLNFLRAKPNAPKKLFKE